MTGGAGRSPDRPGNRRGQLLAVLCLGLVVVIIDNTVLNVAIPEIMRDLPASTAQIQWVVSAYPIAVAGLLIPAGALADRYGRRRLLVLGLLVFGAGSAAAATASSAGELAVLRAVMGAGGALIMPSVLAIITQAFPDEERMKALSVFSATGMVGIAAGPALGGVILEHFWWGAVFLVNVPLVVLGVIGAVTRVPESRDPASRPPDLVGAALSTAALLTLVWALISVPAHGWRGQTAAGLAAGVAATGAFVVWEGRHRAPMLNLRLLRGRRFLCAITLVTIFAIGMAGTLFILTQYLQLVRGYSPLQAGLVLLPAALSGVAGSALGARVASRAGTATTIAVGMAVVVGALCALAATVVWPTVWPVLAGATLLGLGLGGASPAAYSEVLRSVPPSRAATTSAVNDAAQEVGTSFGVAAIGSVVALVYAANLPAGAPDVARESLAGGIAAPGLTGPARHAFAVAMSTGCLAGAACIGVAALLALVLLRDGTPGVAAPSTGDPETATSEVSA